LFYIKTWLTNMWKASAVFKWCFLAVKNSLLLWHSVVRCLFPGGASCDSDGGMVCCQRYFLFFSSYFLFHPLEIRVDYSKFQSCSFIYWHFNLDPYSFDFSFCSWVVCKILICFQFHDLILIYDIYLFFSIWSSFF